MTLCCTTKLLLPLFPRLTLRTACGAGPHSEVTALLTTQLSSGRARPSKKAPGQCKIARRGANFFIQVLFQEGLQPMATLERQWIRTEKEKNRTVTPGKMSSSSRNGNTCDTCSFQERGHIHTCSSATFGRLNVHEKSILCVSGGVL